VFAAGSDDTSFVTWQWAHDNTGSVTFIGPVSPGVYEARLFRNGSRVASSGSPR
jgi:hypothetical protein